MILDEIERIVENRFYENEAINDLVDLFFMLSYIYFKGDITLNDVFLEMSDFCDYMSNNNEIFRRNINLIKIDLFTRLVLYKLSRIR